MGNRDILAIGTSAGGVEALRFLVKGLPRDLPAAVLVTIHISNRATLLDKILTQAGALAASFAAEGEALRQGHVYIAPPERHLIVDNDRLWLGTGPRENSARPAIDPMLRSVAICCGPRAIGVILTGALGDGASGLWALKQAGGITLVQDPSDAVYPEMPMTALNLAKPDHVVRLADLPARLKGLVREPAGKPLALPEGTKREVEIAWNGGSTIAPMDKIHELDRIGRRSVLACPDCGGVMWEIREDDLLRYRCHAGHAYTAEVMGLALEDGLRRALASALRALEERIALARSLQEQAASRQRRLLAEIWAERAKEYEQEAAIIRNSMQRIDELAADAAKKDSFSAP